MIPAATFPKPVPTDPQYREAARRALARQGVAQGQVLEHGLVQRTAGADGAFVEVVLWVPREHAQEKP